MKPLSEDTSPAAERVLIEGMRAMPARRKLRRVGKTRRWAGNLGLSHLLERALLDAGAVCIEVMS